MNERVRIICQHEPIEFQKIDEMGWTTDAVLSIIGIIDIYVCKHCKLLYAEECDETDPSL